MVKKWFSGTEENPCRLCINFFLCCLILSYFVGARSQFNKTADEKNLWRALQPMLCIRFQFHAVPCAHCYMSTASVLDRMENMLRLEFLFFLLEDIVSFQWELLWLTRFHAWRQTSLRQAIENNAVSTDDVTHDAMIHAYGLPHTS